MLGVGGVRVQFKGVLPTYSQQAVMVMHWRFLRIFYGRELVDVVRARDEGLHGIVKELLPVFDCVEALCKSLRGMLSPYEEDGSLGIETKKDLDDLCGPMIGAFVVPIEDNKN